MVNFENGKTPINDTNLNKAQTDLNDEITKLKKEIKSLKGTILYNDEKGTTGDVTLSDSVANYDYIEIYSKREVYDSDTFYFAPTKIDNPNKKIAVINTTYTDNIDMYFYSKVININENTIQVTRSNLVSFGKSETPFMTDTANFITKVVGYKISGDENE